MVIPQKHQSGRRGRGATGNPAGRYEQLERLADDDGWSSGASDGVSSSPPRTTVAMEVARTIVSRNASPDIPFESSINPYRGCEHGCVYCYARPGHAWLGLSPGLDFETRLSAKANAADRLKAELRRPGYVCRPLMLGASTDPYQPVERRLQITRKILEVLAECRHPVAIATRSALILRDLDILVPMAKERLVSVGISVTTLNHDLGRVMEPRAATPCRRLQAMRALSDAGVPTLVMAAPMIPHVNDHELETVLAAAADSGATAAGYTFIRLPHELKDVFSDWLRTHFPDRAARVLARIRECRQGRLYRSQWSERMTGSGTYAALLARRFMLACRRLGLVSSGPSVATLDTTRFRPPPDDDQQLSLF